MKTNTTKKAAVKTTTKKAAVKKMDQYGFTAGTNVSKLWAALIKGAPMTTLKKITGKATYPTMSSFRKSHKDDRWGRVAKIEKNDKGIYKITKFNKPAA